LNKEAEREQKNSEYLFNKSEIETKYEEYFTVLSRLIRNRTPKIS